MIEPKRVSSEEVYTGQRGTTVTFEGDSDYVQTVSLGEKSEVLDRQFDHHSEEELFALLLHVMTGGEFGSEYS